MEFKSFNLNPHVETGVSAYGFVTPTPIQAKAIPAVMNGQDIMGRAQTGTGKTAAFALPILHRLMQGKGGRVRALIIAPTRELAEQIHDDISRLGKDTRIRGVSVYGGVNINTQIQRLKHGAEIVVACPGRLLDHMVRGTIDITNVEILVIDEADHMFDMGFLPDIRRILEHLPSARQTLLFSATMPDEVHCLADDILKNPMTIKVGETAPAQTVTHAYYPVSQHLKTAFLVKLLKHIKPKSVLVFTRTKHRAKRLGEQLVRAGFPSASLQGNLSQGRRQAALAGFRSGKFQVLVATDIAARGIDVCRISHVINYDMPDTSDAYIHRIGRTGRADQSGEAFTLITRDDKQMVRDVDRVMGAKVERRTLPDFDYSMPHNNKHMRAAPFFQRKGRKPIFGLKSTKSIA